MSELGGTLIGSIRIEARLGGGGMGEVWRGFDTRLERTVAVKTVRADRRFAAEFKQRFRREARLLSRLGHPGICQVHDLIETPDADFLVMEYLEGATLERHVGFGFARERLYAIFAQLAGALAAAHGQRIVHRDLKPENIHVGAGDRAKILDFGIARNVQDDVSRAGASTASAPTTVSSGAITAPGAQTTSLLTAPATPGGTEIVPGKGAGAPEVYTGLGQVVGTRGYMSPEQAAGREVGTASDIYALGLCLDAMLERCAEVPPEDRREGAALVARMLAADAQRRPDAEEVERELRRLIELPRARAAALLRRRLVGAVALALLVLVFALVWLAQAARNAREEAEQRRTQAEGLAEYLLGELREQLLEVGRVDLLDSVNQRAQRYLDTAGGDAAIELRPRLLASQLAVMMRRGQYAQAQALAQAALPPAQARVAAAPDDPRALAGLADVHYWLGYLALEQVRDGAEVLAHFDALVDLRERIAAQRPGGRQQAIDLASSLSSRVAALQARGPRALADALRAVAIYRALELAPDDPALADYASTLAWLSSVHENAGELAAAIAVRAENAALLTRLHAADADNAVIAQDLAVALNFQTVLAQQLGRDEEALALVRRACGMFAQARRRDPEDREVERGEAVCRSMHAGVLLSLGRLDEAREQAAAAAAALTQLVREAGLQSDWPGQLVSVRLRLAEVDAEAGRCDAVARQLGAVLADTGGLAPSPGQRARIALLRARCAQQGGDRAGAIAASAEALAALGELAADAPTHLLVTAALAAVGAGQAAPYLERLRARGYRGTLLRQACERAGLGDCLAPQ